MEHDKLVARINELAKKKKESGLTDEELKEQKELREEYLQKFRSNLKQQLDNAVFMKEFYVNKEDLNEKGMENLKNNDAILKIEDQGDKYEIYYDVKKLDENQLQELITHDNN